MNTSFYRFLLIITFFTFAATALNAQSRRKQKDIDKVIGYAKNYIGTPYKYGGSSKKGIDCSALIYNCYTAIGVSLPRTAKDQSKIGNSKNWDSIRPGDIVYFKFKQKGEKWYHTGLITIVEKDKIRFIHASTSRGVVEESLLIDYYSKNVKKFRRVI